MLGLGDEGYYLGIACLGIACIWFGVWYNKEIKQSTK
jgi:hypothetical protein